MSHPADQFIFHKEGPVAIVRACRLCSPSKPFTVLIRKGAGGFAAGNRARGTMIQHIKQAHAEQLRAAIAKAAGGAA